MGACRRVGSLCQRLLPLPSTCIMGACGGRTGLAVVLGTRVKLVPNRPRAFGRVLRPYITEPHRFRVFFFVEGLPRKKPPVLLGTYPTEFSI